MPATKSKWNKGSVKAPLANEADPTTWLYLQTNRASSLGLVFGVLRKSFGSRQNSALEFGYRKAHPTLKTTPRDLKTWTPNAEKVEVILPVEADDMLSDAPTLLGQMDQNAFPEEKSLLVYLTLPLHDASRVHVGWERARAFACKIARERQLASVLVLHAPMTINSPYPLHAHCLIVPKHISKLGLKYGLYDNELICDRGLPALEQLWTEHLEAFG